LPELEADAGAGLKALGINCTLKKSPERSHTEALMRRVLGLLSEHGVETEILRPVDYAIAFGVTSDEGDGDQWPRILEKIKVADTRVDSLQHDPSRLRRSPERGYLLGR
jgi:hypothetical protein